MTHCCEQKQKPQGYLENALSRVHVEEKVKKRLLTFFQCWYTVMNKPKPQGYLKNVLSRVRVEKRVKKGLLTIFQCWYTVVNKQKPQGYLRNALSRVRVKEKDEKKESTYFLPMLVHCYEQAEKTSCPKKGIIKNPHKKKEMDGSYLLLLTNRPLPTKHETKVT